MLDFDLQFLAIAFILILVAECTCEKHITMKSTDVPFMAGLAVTGLSVYFGIAGVAYYFNLYSAAAADFHIVNPLLYCASVRLAAQYNRYIRCDFESSAVSAQK